MIPTTFTRRLFTLDGCPYAFEGLTDENHWNGWATPVFEFEQAKLVLRAGMLVWSYDEASDTFSFRNQDECEADTVDIRGRDVEELVDIWTGTVTRHVYEIGTGWWIWDDCTEHNIPTRLCSCGLNLTDVNSPCPGCGR